MKNQATTQQQANAAATVAIVITVGLFILACVAITRVPGFIVNVL